MASVITEGSPSWLEDDGSVRRTALLGLISVVARIKNTNNRKTRSVIDDAENVGLVFELLLIAIAQTIFVRAGSKYP
jgi:hypothetical protein